MRTHPAQKPTQKTEPAPERPVYRFGAAQPRTEEFNPPDDKPVTVLNLKEVPRPGLPVHVFINGRRLLVADYSVKGADVTLAHPINHSDFATVDYHV